MLHFGPVNVPPRVCVGPFVKTRHVCLICVQRKVTKKKEKRETRLSHFQAVDDSNLSTIDDIKADSVNSADDYECGSGLNTRRNTENQPTAGE